MFSVENFLYLWGGTQDCWVLLTAPELRSGFCIFHSLTSNLLHIDDEQLNDILCKRMKEAGCKVVDNLPVANSVVNVNPR